MLKKITIAATATLCAGTVSAQSMPIGFYANGSLQAEYVSTPSNDYTFGIADISLGYSGAGAGSMPLGFELSLFAIEGDLVLFDPHVLGSVFYDSSYGRFSVGLPGAALADYVETPSFGNSKVLSFEYGIPFGSMLNQFFRTGGAPYDYGVRYDGTVGGADVGLSYHQIDGTDHALSGGISYAINETYTVAAGFESIDGSGVESGYFTSVTADYGVFGGLLNISSPLGINEVFYGVEASYDVLDNLVLTAGYYHTDEDIFSFDAKYGFMDNGYVGASVLGGDGSDTIYTAYVGWDINYGG